MADVKIASLAENTSPTDTNIMIIEDNSDTKKITFANIKAILKTYFDGLYATVANLNLKAPLADPIFTGTQTLPNIVTNGIKFPAVQVPSADPNTLDDYEEGTYTPVVSASVGTINAYTIAEAKYTKNGRSVEVFVECTLTDVGTGTGNLLVTLPFSNSGSFAGVGKEVAVTGKAVAIVNAGNLMSIRYFDNTTSIANGLIMFLSVTYTV